MAARSKRNVKLPKHLQDAGYIDPATFGGEPKAVYRLVKKEELTGSLLHQTVYVLWPDDGIWYQAVVKKLRASDMLATLYYTRTDELENDVDMNELVETKQIAFRELRPTSYELGDDEILCTKENQDGEDEGYGLEDEDEDEEPADDDDEDEEPQDDDDEDYHVGEGEAELDDDGPLSGSKRKASRLEDDEVGDARALGQNLLNSILGGDSAPKPPAPRAPPKMLKPKPSARSQAAQAAAREQEKRNKLKEGLTMRMAKAVQEAQARGEDPSMYDNARVEKLVTDIEAALYDYAGREVGKPYLDKARSLLFNLNSNPDLRRAVYTGAVSAVRLVRMTPEEMAPRQLQEERRKLEEKSLKMSVLPEGTSFINYVTRREELVQRETGRTRTPPPRGGSPEAPKQPRSSPPPILQGPPVAPPPKGPLIKSPPSAPGSAGAAASGAAFAVDWAAIRAQAATAAEEAKAVGQLEGFDDDLMAADLLVDDPAQNEVVPPPATDTNRPASPLTHHDPMTSHTTSRIPPTLADVHGLDLWQHAGLPAGGIVGPGGTPPGTLVWASGTLRVPGSGAYAVEATSLCGGGDLAAMFTGLSKVEVEGRVSEEKLERFLHDLRNSRSRSVTLALLTATQEASQDATEVETFAEVVAGYASRKRAGVSHIASGLEMYLIAPDGLGKQLLRTVHESAVQGEAPPAAVAALPDALSQTQMLVAVVHSKSWKPPPAASTAIPTAPVVAPDEYDPMQAPLVTLPSVDPLQPTQSSVPGAKLAPSAAAAAPPATSLPFEIPDAAALSALLSSLPPAPAGGTSGGPAGGTSGGTATDQAVLPPNLDLNALNDLAATLLGPAAADPGAAPMAPIQQPQQQQPPVVQQQLQPRPMFRDPRAGPTVPLDLPPELAAELQRIRGGMPGMAAQPLPVGARGPDAGRRNKWDVGPR